MTVLSNYKQIGREKTHISDTLKDHVYIQNKFLESVNATTQIARVHFSDHEAVKFCISNKLCEQIFLTFAHCVCFSFVFFTFSLISFKQNSLTFSIFFFSIILKQYYYSNKTMAASSNKGRCFYGLYFDLHFTSIRFRKPLTF